MQVSSVGAGRYHGRVFLSLPTNSSVFTTLTKIQTLPFPELAMNFFSHTVNSVDQILLFLHAEVGLDSETRIGCGQSSYNTT